MEKIRGIVLYWNADKGLVTVDGKRLGVNISAWRGYELPKTHMAVEIDMHEGVVISFSKLEKPPSAIGAALSGSLGGSLKQSLRETVDGKLTAENCKETARRIVADVGTNVAVAYGAFMVAAISMRLADGGMFRMMTVTLVDVLSGLAGSRPAGIALLLLVAASIAVPFFWRHRVASLALATPLLATLVAGYRFYSVQAMMREQNESSSAFVKGVMGAFTDGMGLSLGYYVLLVLGAYLAYQGITRVKRRPSAEAAA
ncbi:hypothetical protein [Pelomonas sp. Root1444]|uniref:hypothetical protein n=1 Tax=Pelomonas sp. Root1444 TaxID=1736464 RepID=UPI000A4340F3|nr:hypothetical protein [Pelomonas sp. Root1444]